MPAAPRPHQRGLGASEDDAGISPKLGRTLSSPPQTAVTPASAAAASPGAVSLAAVDRKRLVHGAPGASPGR
jgi:hypothetical protein